MHCPLNNNSVQSADQFTSMQAIDTVIGTIQERFYQKGFQMLQRLETTDVKLFSGDFCNLSEIVWHLTSEALML